MKTTFESVLVGRSEGDGDGSNDAGAGFKITDVQILQAGQHEAVPLDDKARGWGEDNLAEVG